MTSVIIVQYNRIDLTIQAVTSFQRHHGDSCEIIVVDNASNPFDETAFLRALPAVRLIRNGTNEGFGRANNRAARVAKGDILLFLNSDTVADSAFVPAVERRFASEPETGVLGPGLRFSDGTFQLSAGLLPSFRREIRDKWLYGLLDRRVKWMVERTRKKYEHTQFAGWVTGAALFIRAELFAKLGGFDERMFMYFEDKDLCKRAGDLGFAVRFLPEVSLIHLKEGTSAGNRSESGNVYRRSQIEYYRKHRAAPERLLLSLYLRLTGTYPAG